MKIAIKTTLKTIWQMNGELQCHKSESVIIKIATIVVHSYICECISVSQCHSITVHQKLPETNITRPSGEGNALTFSGGSSFFFFLRGSNIIKKSCGHFYDPCSWAFMGRSTNGGWNQRQQRSIVPFKTHTGALGVSINLHPQTGS